MFLGAYRDWQASSQTALDLTSWSGVTACDAGVGRWSGSMRAHRATFLPTLGSSRFSGGTSPPGRYARRGTGGD
jgi:hypothetical protein